MEDINLTEIETEEIEDLTMEGAEPDSLEVPDLETLDGDEQKKVEAIYEQIDITDTQDVIQYGVKPQKKVTNFADNILSQVRAKDTGYVGNILTELMTKIKGLDVEDLSSEDSFLSKIPLLGSLVDSTKKFIKKYDKVEAQIEKITDQLEEARRELLKDIKIFDKLYDKNMKYLNQLTYYIIAGEKKLEEIEEEVIPQLREKAETSNNPVDAQEVNDMMQFAERFEKKLHDLKLSRTIALQTAPQIRLIQNNNQLLVEKIQTSILNTIPLWKNQIVIALGMSRQGNALQMQKKVNQTTNEMLLKNSEMLKENSLQIAEESEKGIVELETLKEVNDNLISTLEETIRIQQEGREKRQQVETELNKMEQALKDKLISLKDE